ncbi:MAG TPA: translation factor GTPase family protein [Gaiellaceae bacterium]|nr:translation factor GTPase family protein [Gaiellaceae bacterium]
MLERTLNLGILAHVDAGKTTLTERLLYAAGVIDEIGRVDDGTTQTDTLPLEQRRGITIKSAVVSFAIDDVRVNLIDTPGHPDFIAEVERVLSVLDGAVLVISAVEGVQSQTPLLMRALQRLGVPTLIFVNKLDRVGADADRVREEISARLTPAIVPVDDRAKLAEVLAERDDSLLAAYVEGDGLPYRRLREELAAQTGRALVHPVFVGSAKTGEGVDDLMAGIAELLPASAGDAEGSGSGSVFKIERGPAGEKIAYVRMFSGTVHARERLNDEKVTAISVFDAGDVEQRSSVSAGEIAKLWGLGSIQIGDRIGEAPPPRREFAPPTLESVVVPTDPDDATRLRVALGQLAEQDPLIEVRQDDERHEMSVSLYGEVQKEVIQATLAEDYGIDVEFHETKPIYIERLRRVGEAIEILNTETNPYRATIGLRVEPAREGSGVEFLLEVDHRRVPLYAFKKLDSFGSAMEEYVSEQLQEGLYGWRVPDCVVTMTDSNYSSPDGPQSTRGPLSTAADFRKLTPIVVMQALESAGTVVCEPTARVGLEVPTHAVGAVIPALARLGATFETPAPNGERSTITAVLPATRADELHRELPALTGGEGVLDSSLAGYQPVSGEPPTRRRTRPNPLNLGEYVARVERRLGP